MAKTKSYGSRSGGGDDGSNKKKLILAGVVIAALGLFAIFNPFAGTPDEEPVVVPQQAAPGSSADAGSGDKKARTRAEEASGGAPADAPATNDQPQEKRKVPKGYVESTAG